MASSSSDILDAHCFRSQCHQDLFEGYLAKKSVTPETCFELQEDEYPEIQEEIAKRGWRRLSKPRTKISKVLIQEFYSNAVRTKEEVASGENYPYQSYVRGLTIDFSAINIKNTLRIRHMTPGAQTDFKTRQMEDRRLDEVIRDICIPGNKSEITVHRAILIHSIINGEDVGVEELISDIIAIVVEGVQGRGKLIFPSTIYKLSKEAGVSFSEFKGTEYIPIEKPITARVMVRTRGKNANYIQEQHMEEEDHMQPYYNEAEYDNDQEHEQPEVDFEAPKQHYAAPNNEFFNNFQEQQQQSFQQMNEQFSNMQLQQMQFFENMQKTQAQYLEELKALKTKQDEMHTQQNNFYYQIKKEQGELAKEIEEIKKFQANQTLMGFRASPLDKMEERIHETRNKIIEMLGQIKEWTRNASTREAYYCWAHQQANPNLVPIPAREIAKFVHDNAAKKRNIFHGALKNFEQGEPSKTTDTPMDDAKKES
ncbi:hypothetical protein PIB30_081084 [Stylosanthes scabra]|uniref:Putative plant transposon protein domain-containing protein n=1 Tax=Stylosanthes scabra TaxID=79078 RepID=A0ABU6YRX9_9FABA|nr:hypothetical protein [Stylosanthes scabra]